MKAEIEKFDKGNLTELIHEYFQNEDRYNILDNERETFQSLQSQVKTPKIIENLGNYETQVVEAKELRKQTQERIKSANEQMTFIAGAQLEMPRRMLDCGMPPGAWVRYGDKGLRINCSKEIEVEPWNLVVISKGDPEALLKRQERRRAGLMTAGKVTLGSVATLSVLLGVGFLFWAYPILLIPATTIFFLAIMLSDF